MTKKKDHKEAPTRETAEKKKKGGHKPVRSGLAEELEKFRQELAATKEALLRAHAEMDNTRKRAQREIAEARRFAIEKFSVALLDVMDNLERALEVEEGNEQGLREGVSLTLNSWHELMKRFDLERIDAVGEKFDPHRHEALSQVPSEAEAGPVIAQHVAGYTLHGRLIRPARVIVSSGKAGQKEKAA
ncbi:MAG: nucleotide exchange factor GrpE [Mariprofundaceae bacterium]|nr:nucleotide exchange factor GrpE [Mariprofundaceae bacterium]